MLWCTLVPIFSAKNMIQQYSHIVKRSLWEWLQEHVFLEGLKQWTMPRYKRKLDLLHLVPSRNWKIKVWRNQRQSTLGWSSENSQCDITNYNICRRYCQQETSNPNRIQSNKIRAALVCSAGMSGKPNNPKNAKQPGWCAKEKGGRWVITQRGDESGEV